MSTSLTGRRRAYVAVQVTLTAGANRLLDLVNVVLAAETGMATPPMVCPDACSQLSIQSDQASAGSDVVLIGDALVSSSRYGYSLAGKEKREYRAPLNTIQFGSLYASGNGFKVNIEVMTS